MTGQWGKYRLVRDLAKGGMAEVSLAVQVGPGGFEKPVAIKRIRQDLPGDSEFVTMFLDEARLAACFAHPNIVQIYELGELNGQYFVAMEYVHGKDLRRIQTACQAAGTRFPVDIAVRIASQACTALDYAHGFEKDGKPLRVIHRDVSPQNVMLTYDGTVKVVDFGVAKATINFYQTQAMQLKGKIAYMSPEQIRQDGILDRRADLFALGVVLFELLAGERPFQGITDPDLMTAILHNPPPDLGRLSPEIPEPLVRIVARALEKDRNRRYATAALMHADLEAVLEARGADVSPRALAGFLRQLLPPTPLAELVPHPRALATVDLGPGANVARAAALADAGASVPTLVTRRRKRAPSTATRDRPSASGRAVEQRRARVLAWTVCVGLAAASLALWSSLHAPAPADRAPETMPAAAPSEGTSPPDADGAPGERPALAGTGGALTDNDDAVVTKSTLAPSRESSGWLMVTAEPEVQVLVDGRWQAATPMTAPLVVAPGAHVVELVNHKLGIRFRRTLVAVAGEQLQLDKQFRRGQLQVFVSPYGEVFVDDANIGLTPLDQPLSLYEGVHQLRVVCALSGKEKSAGVRIRPGQTTRVSWDLR